MRLRNPLKKTKPVLGSQPKKGKKKPKPKYSNITCPLCGAKLKMRADIKEPQVLELPDRSRVPKRPNKSRASGCHIAVKTGPRRGKILCPKQFGGAKSGNPQA
jgi:hypothetical protein